MEFLGNPGYIANYLINYKKDENIIDMITMLDYAFRNMEEDENLLKDSEKDDGIFKMNVVKRIMDLCVFSPFSFEHMIIRLKSG